jgi:hypothetical protein
MVHRACVRRVRAGGDPHAGLLVPELQRRGLFHRDYAGPTLRDNLGLSIPRAADWHARDGGAVTPRG